MNAPKQLHPWGIVLILTLSIPLLLITGCATMVRGNSQQVTINSDPPGAHVMLSTGYSGITPLTVELKRKSTVHVTIEKKGFKAVRTALVSTIDGGSLAVGTVVNFLFLPVINDIVDYNSGANYSLKPNPLYVRLIPESSGEEYQRVDPRDFIKQESVASSQSSQAAKPSKQYLLNFKYIREDYDVSIGELQKGQATVVAELNLPDPDVLIQRSSKKIVVSNNENGPYDRWAMAITSDREKYYVFKSNTALGNEPVTLLSSDFMNEFNDEFPSGFNEIIYFEFWVPSRSILIYDKSQG